MQELLGEIETGVQVEREERIEGDEATVRQFTVINARIDEQAEAGNATAEELTAINASVDEQRTTIVQSAEAIARLGGTVQYQINTNGHIAGWALSNQVGRGRPYAAFTFVADSFQISSANGARSPFVAYTRTRQINGVQVPAGVYLQEAFIRKAAIDTLHIRGNAVTVPAAATGNFVNGTGHANFAHLVSSAVNLSIASPVLVLWSIEQGYPQGNAAWSIRFRVNGSVLHERGDMRATADYPSGQFLLNRPAGITTVAMDWGGTAGKVSARGSLTLMGVQR